MENLHYYYAIIEEALLKLNFNPIQCRGSVLGQWNIKKDTAGLWLDIWHSEAENRAYFQVMSPILNLPVKNELELFEELLDLNFTLGGAFFAFYRDRIWIKSNRECKGLDSNEAAEIINRVGKHASHYDKELLQKFALS